MTSLLRAWGGLSCRIHVGSFPGSVSVRVRVRPGVAVCKVKLSMLFRLIIILYFFFFLFKKQRSFVFFETCALLCDFGLTTIQ